MTTSTNHGYALANRKVEIGAATQYSSDTSNSGMFFQASPFLKYGYDDSLTLGLTSGFYSENTRALNSVGTIVQYTKKLENSSFSFGANVDLYFNINYSLNISIDGESDSPEKVRFGLSPALSLAYCFSDGDVRPFIGAKASGALATLYGGLDWQFVFIKPSLTIGIYRPYLTLFSASGITYLLEPAISLEF